MYGSRLEVVRGRTPTDRWGYRIMVRPTGAIDALERLRPDLIVLHDCFAFPRAVAAWADTNDVPLAMVCHSDLTLVADEFLSGTRRLAGAGLRSIQRRGLARAPLVLIPSLTTGRRIRDDIQGESAHIPLGVDLEIFGGADPDPELYRSLTPQGGALLLYAGRLSREKGVMLLPQALAEVRVPMRLVMAGTGSLQTRLQAEAIRLGVGDLFTFLGHVASRNELATLMATADCFMHPNANEAFGLAPLEALAAGCRVVAPSSGGCAENLARRGSVLVDPDDPNAMARGIERALAGPRPHPDTSGLGWEETFAHEWAVYRGYMASPCV